jgi:hypothetical protein
MDDKKMAYLQFIALYRNDPNRFWLVYDKVCSCDKGDVRYDSGRVECGECGSKLRVK